MGAEAAKRSPELIQLLELHQQFATITPYSQVGQVSIIQAGRPIVASYPLNVNGHITLLPLPSNIVMHINTIPVCRTEDCFVL